MRSPSKFLLEFCSVLAVTQFPWGIFFFKVFFGEIREDLRKRNAFSCLGCNHPHGERQLRMKNSSKSSARYRQSKKKVFRLEKCMENIFPRRCWLWRERTNLIAFISETTSELLLRTRRSIMTKRRNDKTNYCVVRCNTRMRYQNYNSSVYCSWYAPDGEAVLQKMIHFRRISNFSENDF